MAEVFLAEQTSLKRNVAVKVLREERLTDPTYLKRFKTEALAAAALSHPNIVQVYMIGEQQGTHFIAQEYVQGLNLREFLSRKGPPELGVALKVMKQVASALQAAHAAGIVHRDIKPENIMLTRKGEVKVADFGLAQLTQAGEKVDLTQVGVTMGTPLYMSPEQVNGRKLDARSDIYSFGVTCYHMLAGAPPFRGETALSVAVQHLKQEPDRLEQIRGDLPPMLCRIIHKMMAKNADKRYATAFDVLKDLRRVSLEGNDRGTPAALDDEEPAAEEITPSSEGGRLRRMATGLWRLPDRSFAAQFFVFSLLALLVGGASAGVGWLARDPDPFQMQIRQAAPIQVKETAAAQYMYAQKLKTDPAAYQAVIDNFPNPKERLFQNYARQELALLLLTKRRYDEALSLFTDLAASSESQFRAFGQAGEAFILTQHGEYQRSQRAIDGLKPHYDKLDQRMQALVRVTVKRNLNELKRELDDGWKALLDQPDSEASGGTGSS